MKKSIRNSVATAVFASLATLTAAGWNVPAQASGSRTIVGQGAYLCQSKPKGLPFETYNVTLRISLTAPASVAPGQTVSLSGTGVGPGVNRCVFLGPGEFVMDLRYPPARIAIVRRRARRPRSRRRPARCTAGAQGATRT